MSAAGWPGGRVRRARWPRYLLPALVLLLVLEVWLLVQLGHVIGPRWVLVLLLAESLAGFLVLRRAGRAALEAFRAGSGAPWGTPVPGRAPGTVGDALLTGAGGVLLVLPGLVSDVVGLLFVLPPTRRAVRRFGTRWITRRVEQAVRRAGGPVVPGSVVDPDGRHGGGRHGGGGHGDVVEGEVLPDPSRELGDGRRGR